MSIYYSDFNIERYLAFKSEIYGRYAPYARNLRDLQERRTNSLNTDQIEITCKDDNGWFYLMFSIPDGRYIGVPLSEYSSPISELRSWMERMINTSDTNNHLTSEYIADCEDDYYIFNFEQINEDGDGIFTIYNTYECRDGSEEVEAFDAYCNYKWLICMLYTTVLHYWENHSDVEYFSWDIGNRESTENPKVVASLIKSQLIEEFIKHHIINSISNEKNKR